MGASASHLTADEQSLLLKLTGEEPLPYDSEAWLNLFGFKVSLDSLTADAIARDFKDYVERLGERAGLTPFAMRAPRSSPGCPWPAPHRDPLLYPCVSQPPQ
jgi:hypothetical protein